MSGEVTVTAGTRDHEIYLIIAAMPEHYSSSQRYSYQFQIDRAESTPPVALTWETCSVACYNARFSGAIAPVAHPAS